MGEEFLKELLALCEKYGEVTFAYTTQDDGCIIEIDGEQIIDKLWGADDIRDKLDEIESK